jgi:hypothetical protein
MTHWNPKHFKTLNVRLPVQLAAELRSELQEDRINWQQFMLAAALAYRSGEWKMPRAKQLADEEQAWLAQTGGDHTNKSVPTA